MSRVWPRVATVSSGLEFSTATKSGVLLIRGGTFGLDSQYVEFGGKKRESHKKGSVVAREQACVT